MYKKFVKKVRNSNFKKFMTFIPKNDKFSNYQKDLNLLKIYTSLLDNSTQQDKQLIKNFFDLYDNVYCFYFYHYSRNIFPKNDLKFAPFDSGLKNFTPFKPKADESLSFQAIQELDGYECLKIIWTRFCAPEDDFLLKQPVADIRDCIKIERGRLVEIQNTEEKERVHQFLGINLFYNLYLSQFYECVAARQVLVETFKKLTNFSFIDTNLLKTILILDDQNLKLVVEFDDYFQHYVETYNFFLSKKK